MAENVEIFIHGTDTQKMHRLTIDLTNCSLPQDVSLKIVTINGERNEVHYRQLTEGSNAKYKVFIDGTGILGANFLPKLLFTFQRYPDIGMIGLLGSNLPPCGTLSQARKIYGAYLNTLPDNRTIAHRFINPCLFVEDVQNLDTHFLATQYDLPWPQDVTDPFLVARHALSMKKAGYRTCVMEHDGYYMSFEVNSDYDPSTVIQQERWLSFLRDCGRDAFPLVSILIPAYNQPDFLREALESAIAQDYPNTEIVIGDDSTDTRVKDMMAKYLEKYPQIRYYYHGGPLGKMGTNNINFLIANAHGEYISILNHDDLFHPQKVTRMMDVILFDKDHKFAIVTSPRNIMDEHGKETSRSDYWKPFMPQRISSGEAARRILCLGQNFIGEPTCVLFRKSDLPIDAMDGEHKYAVFCGMEDRGMKDMATWLELLKSGGCMFLLQDLSSFRKHSDQGTFDSTIRILTVLDTLGYVILAWLHNLYLRNEVDFRESCNTWLGNSHKLTTMPKHRKIPKDVASSKYMEQIEKFQTLIKKEKYDLLLSQYIEYLLSRKDGVDREQVLSVCQRNPETGLWEKRKCAQESVGCGLRK